MINQKGVSPQKTLNDAYILAVEAVRRYDPRAKEPKVTQLAACAFHHAIDLLLYAEGSRRTTRCMPQYKPNPIELEVESILRTRRKIHRGMRDGVRV